MELKFLSQDIKNIREYQKSKAKSFTNFVIIFIIHGVFYINNDNSFIILFSFIYFTFKSHTTTDFDCRTRIMKENLSPLQLLLNFYYERKSVYFSGIIKIYICVHNINKNLRHETERLLTLTKARVYPLKFLLRVFL